MNGKNHYIANTSILLIGSVMASHYTPDFLLPIIGGLTFGTLITPDYDLKQIYIKMLLNKVPLIGTIWNSFWFPYAIIFKHRGISHNLIIGTITRFLYLIIPLVLIIWILQIRININQVNIYIFLLFWYIQDISHYILDMKRISEDS